MSALRGFGKFWRALVGAACCAASCACSSGASSQASCAALSPACPAAPPSYATDIAPLLAAKCTTCHRPGDPSGAWPLDTYARVAGWDSAVFEQLERCSMPPRDSGIEMSSGERQRIADWINCGSRDN